MTTALKMFASLLRGSRADSWDVEGWDDDYDEPHLTPGLIVIDEPPAPPDAPPAIWLPSTDGYRKHTLHPPHRPFGFRSR